MVHRHEKLGAIPLSIIPKGLLLEDVGRYKWLSPATADLLLQRAREATETILDRMAVYEKMTPSELLRNSEELNQLYEAVLQSFLHAVPAGMPHEQHVLDHKEWVRAEQPQFITDFQRVVQPIPESFYKLVLSLPTLKIQQEALASNARKGGVSAKAKNPAARAMEEIKKEWLQQQSRPGYKGDAAFARAMHAKYARDITNEGSIKNAISKLRSDLKGRKND
jgi:hypothetical protein